MAATKRPTKRSVPRQTKPPRREPESPSSVEIVVPRPRSRADAREDRRDERAGDRGMDRIVELEAELERSRAAREEDGKALGEMLARMADVERAKKEADARASSLAARLGELEADLARRSDRELEATLRELTGQRDGFERAARSAQERERGALEREKDAHEHAHRLAVQRDGFERAAMEAERRARDGEAERAREREDQRRRIEQLERRAVELAAELDDVTRQRDRETARADERATRAHEFERKVAALGEDLASQRRARHEMDAHAGALERELERVQKALAAAERQQRSHQHAAADAAELLDELARSEDAVAALRAKTVAEVKKVLATVPVTIAAPALPSRPSGPGGETEELPLLSLPPEAIRDDE